MLGTTNEDGGWEKGGFGVSADEKPSTTAAQSFNIVYGVKRGNVRGSSHRGLTGTVSGVSDSTRDWGNGRRKMTIK
jgi:hypothetical protein